MVFHDEIHAARPEQILLGVDLVIVVSSALIHPRIDVGERYRAIVLLVNLDRRCNFHILPRLMIVQLISFSG